VLCDWVNVCQLSSSLSAAAVSERQISKSVMMNIPERSGIKYCIVLDTETSPHLESFSSGLVLSDHRSPREERRLAGFLRLWAGVCWQQSPCSRGEPSCCFSPSEFKNKQKLKEREKSPFF